MGPSNTLSPEQPEKLRHFAMKQSELLEAASLKRILEASPMKVMDEGIICPFEKSEETLLCVEIIDVTARNCEDLKWVSRTIDLVSVQGEDRNPSATTGLRLFGSKKSCDRRTSCPIQQSCWNQVVLSQAERWVHFPIGCAVFEIVDFSPKNWESSARKAKLKLFSEMTKGLDERRFNGILEPNGPESLTAFRNLLVSW